MPHPRVNDHVDDIYNEVGGEHHQDQEEEASLNQEIVTLPNGLHHGIAKTWIGKHHLCQNSSGNDCPKAYR